MWCAPGVDGGGVEGSDWFRAQESLKAELLGLADRGILLRDPETGLIAANWVGYNEGMMANILALGAPVMVPKSVLNDLRRQVVAEIESIRLSWSATSVRVSDVFPAPAGLETSSSTVSVHRKRDLP